MSDVSDDHKPMQEKPKSEKIEAAVDARPVYDADVVNPNPSFQEYLYWASLRREVENADHSNVTSKGLSTLFKKLKGEKSGDVMADEAPSAPESDDDLVGLSERDAEHANARRALRQAGWATVFYLVTCDILGPFNAPYAIASIGLLPGILLLLGGAMLSKLFLRLDSVRYPVKTYGDLADRVFGKWAKHSCSILQSIQLVLNVGLICLSNGQSLSQISQGKLCFSVCVVIWTFCGMFIGQIRGLQNFSIVANASVWINLSIIFISMGFVANSVPNYAAAISTYGADAAKGPVLVQAIVANPVFAQVNGVFNMVFAWGGAMIFPEIMAEMRRPRDFIRGMAMAQGLIFCAYLLYGVFVYSFQGQYTLPVAYQGVSKYAWQTVGNVLALVTGIIAAGLYGNIGLKVFYITIVEDLFKGPAMSSRKGRYLWFPMVILYWSLAFIIGSAIPSVGALSGLVAAVCIFQFTYTFPPLLMLGLDMSIDAAAEDEPFTTPGVAPRQVDTWKSMSRWNRGFFGGGQRRLLIKVANLFFFLAAVSTAGLGMWATGTDLRESLAVGAATSFGCASPV